MNILLIRTKAGIEYASHIRDYIVSKGVNCFITDVNSAESFIRSNGLTPENTLIHSRTAGPVTNDKIADLENAGFTVINPAKTLNLTSNKYLSQVHAEESGIPVAKTYKVDKTDVKKVREILSRYGWVVLKPVFSQGQGVFCRKINADIGDTELAEIIQSVPGEEIQVQQFIDYEILIRVIVIGFKAVRDATIYDLPDKDWKCSVCLNPKIKKYYEGTDALFDLAEKTAKEFNAKVNFIDFFKDKKGDYILNEINTACNLFFHEEASGVKINELIGDFLINQAGQLRKA